MKRERALFFVILLLLALLVSFTPTALADAINLNDDVKPDISDYINSSVKRVGPAYSELVDCIDYGSAYRLDSTITSLNREIKNGLIVQEFLVKKYETSMSRKELAIYSMYRDYLLELRTFPELIGNLERKYEQSLSKKDLAVYRMCRDYQLESKGILESSEYKSRYPICDTYNLLYDPETVWELYGRSKALSHSFKNFLDVCESHGFECNNSPESAEQLRKTISTPLIAYWPA